MKFSIGDVVIIKKDLVIDGWYHGYLFTDEMAEYTGAMAEVVKVTKHHTQLSIDNGRWGWTEDMLELVTKEDLGEKLDHKCSVCGCDIWERTNYHGFLRRGKKLKKLRICYNCIEKMTEIK